MEEQYLVQKKKRLFKGIEEYSEVHKMVFDIETEGLDPEIKLRIEEYISFLKNSGFEIVNINLPYTQYSIATYYILTTAEASSNLSRFDGARYGFRSDSASSLADMYTHSRSEGFNVFKNIFRTS